MITINGVQYNYTPGKFIARSGFFHKMHAMKSFKTGTLTLDWDLIGKNPGFSHLNPEKINPNAIDKYIQSIENDAEIEYLKYPELVTISNYLLDHIYEERYKKTFDRPLVIVEISENNIQYELENFPPEVELTVDQIIHNLALVNKFNISYVQFAQRIKLDNEIISLLCINLQKIDPEFMKIVFLIYYLRSLHKVFINS